MLSPDDLPMIPLLTNTELKADILVANILAEPLIELADHLATLVNNGGEIILSGILVEQVDTIINKYQAWFDDFETMVDDNWACLRGRKKN